MNGLQASHLSSTISAMQSTVVSTLRRLGTDHGANESDRILYARWYCKRAIAQELSARAIVFPDAGAQDDAQLLAPEAAATPVIADSTHSWADQVQTYLRSKRSFAPKAPLSAPPQ